MTLTEAFVKTAFLKLSDDTRAKVISLLMTGEVEICDNCGFTVNRLEICGVCESAWADEQAAKEEELSWGRLEMAGGRW